MEDTREHPLRLKNGGTPLQDTEHHEPFVGSVKQSKQRDPLEIPNFGETACASNPRKNCNAHQDESQTIKKIKINLVQARRPPSSPRMIVNRI